MTATSRGWPMFKAIVRLKGSSMTLAMRQASSAVNASRRSVSRSKSVQERTLDVLRLDRDGGRRRERIKLVDLVKNSPGLQIRDLLVLDRGYRLRQTAILPRQDCILVSLQALRAIVYRDHVMLFDPTRQAVSVFADSFDARDSAMFSSLPYELHVVEMILESVSDSSYRRLRLYGPVIRSLLSELTDERESEALLRRLLVVKNSLSSFEVLCQEYCTTLSELLNNDEDLLEMNLSIKSTLADGEKLPYEAHEQAELLFENYLRQFQEMYQDAFYLRKSIESSVELANINLSSVRNRFMQMSLQMNMATLALTVNAVLASVFGMNLISGFEASPAAFWIVSGTMSIVSPAVYVALHNYSRKNNAELRIREMQAVQGMVTNMEDVEQILRAHSADEAGMDKVTFKRLLSSASGRAVGDHEVDLIYQIFDYDGSGVLTHHKYMSALKFKTFDDRT